MGKFREAAHNICNLRHKVPREIPVKFHVAQHTITTLLLKNQQKSLKTNLHAQVEIQKNILAFQYQLKKNIMMILMNQLHTE